MSHHPERTARNVRPVNQPPSKDYDREDQIPADQMIKIECAKVFFANLEAEGYKVVFHPQLKQDKIAGIIAAVLRE